MRGYRALDAEASGEARCYCQLIFKDYCQKIFLEKGIFVGSEMFTDFFLWVIDALIIFAGESSDGLWPTG
jgi:hypothetical protein